MPQERFTNNAQSTLNGAINNSVTTLTITSATPFPTVGQFRLRIDDEIVVVTGVSGTTFTIVRGQEGTSAASHSSGATVRHVLTAGALDLIGVPDPVAALFGVPTTAFEFDTNSLTGLTAIGTPTVEDANTTIRSGLYYRDTSASMALMGRYLASPSTPFTAVTKVMGFNPSANYNLACMFVGVADPTTGAFVTNEVEYNANTKIVANKFTNRTTFSAQVGVGINYPSSPVYLAMVVNSTTSIDYYWSMDGWVWRKYVSAANPTLTVGSVGVGLASQNAGGAGCAFDYLRIWGSALTFPG